ncbi:MAG: hypothetical protein JSV16_12535, partial [Candidatus Hydrogenedentota bacterium]
SFLIPPTDEEAALEKLEETIALRPDEAIYRRMAAKMLLRRADASRAAEHLKRALECLQSPSERAQTYLLLGFSHDLLGMRNEATRCYQDVLKLANSGTEDVLSAVNRFVIADARKYSRVPFTQNDATKIEISFEITSKYDL